MLLVFDQLLYLHFILIHVIITLRPIWFTNRVDRKFIEQIRFWMFLDQHVIENLENADKNQI